MLVPMLRPTQRAKEPPSYGSSLLQKCQGKKNIPTAMSSGLINCSENLYLGRK